MFTREGTRDSAMDQIVGARSKGALLSIVKCQRGVSGSETVERAVATGLEIWGNVTEPVDSSEWSNRHLACTATKPLNADCRTKLGNFGSWSKDGPRRIPAKRLATNRTGHDEANVSFRIMLLPREHAEGKLDENRRMDIVKIHKLVPSRAACASLESERRVSNIHWPVSTMEGDRPAAPRASGSGLPPCAGKDRRLAPQENVL